MEGSVFVVCSWGSHWGDLSLLSVAGEVIGHTGDLFLLSVAGELIVHVGESILCFSK